jgi:selenide,water dikinase
MTGQERKQVVLVGGGHAHALVLRALQDVPLDRAEVVLINPGQKAPYSGMLPGFVAGHYTRSELDIDLVKLCERAGVSFVDGRVVAADSLRKVVVLQDGSEVPYDILSYDVGITSRMEHLKGFAELAVPAKPLEEFATRWDAYRAADGSKNVAVIGGGIAGAELAMAMSFALSETQSGGSVRLIDRSKILSANTTQARKRIRAALHHNDVEIVEGADVTAITDQGVALANGTFHKANFVIGAAGATPHHWMQQTGLDLHNGFIAVDSYLRSDEDGVFAVGDCAHLSFDPRPKAGVYAVRQAPVLLNNIRMALSGRPLKAYVPQADYLKLISLGSKRAFGERYGFRAQGHLVWLLKDRIDRSFMAQFQ